MAKKKKSFHIKNIGKKKKSFHIKNPRYKLDSLTSLNRNTFAQRSK